MNKEKFKTMSSQEKMDFIWDYYRWWILAGIVILVFAGVTIYKAATHKDPLMNVVMLDSYVESTAEKGFQPFLEQAGYEYYDDAIAFSNGIQLNGSDDMYKMTSIQALMASLAAGEVDVFFWDTDQVPEPLQDGALMDLRQVLPPELLAKYQDHLVYFTNPDTGATYPYGIYLEKNPWIMDNKYYVNCSIGISVSCHNTDLAVQLFEFILE